MCMASVLPLGVFRSLRRSFPKAYGNSFIDRNQLAKEHTPDDRRFKCARWCDHRAASAYCRAIINSSSGGTLPAPLVTGSQRVPNHASAAADHEFSPMPAVKTKASGPPNAAASVPALKPSLKGLAIQVVPTICAIAFRDPAVYRRCGKLVRPCCVPLLRRRAWS
jgi:hypothetical protein